MFHKQLNILVKHYRITYIKAELNLKYSNYFSVYTSNENAIQYNMTLNLLKRWLMGFISHIYVRPKVYLYSVSHNLFSYYTHCIKSITKGLRLYYNKLGGNCSSNINQLWGYAFNCFMILDSYSTKSRKTT